MKKPTKNTKWLLSLAIVWGVMLMGMGCGEEEIFSGKQDISGTWEVFKQRIKGNLKDIIAPPDNAYYTNISMVIPDSSKGGMGGHTFYNTFGVEFEIRGEGQISFNNFIATRISEDDWGRTFQENILNSVKYDFFGHDELHFIDSQNQTVIVFIENKNR